jgi:hypothetical protein
MVLVQNKAIRERLKEKYVKYGKNEKAIKTT